MEGQRAMRQMPSIDAFRLLKTMSDADHSMTMTRIEAKARIRFTVAQALAQGRVSFHFQPVVSASNPRMPAFYEMLARLRLPNGQILPAGGFMPARRASGGVSSAGVFHPGGGAGSDAGATTTTVYSMAPASSRVATV